MRAYSPEQPPRPAEQPRKKKLFGKMRGLVAGAAMAMQPACATMPLQTDVEMPHESGRVVDTYNETFERYESKLRTLFITGSRSDRSVAELKEAREQALKQGIQEIVQGLVEQMDSPGESPEDRFVSLEVLLSSADCQGILYREYVKKFGKLPERHQAFYAAHVRDYMPRGYERRGGDIDPRLPFAAGGHGAPSTKTLQAMLEVPAWTTPKRMADFGRLVDQEGIRTMAKAADLTLAEFFSLIKATIVHLEKTGGDVSDAESVEPVAKALLEERQRFAETELLGPSTESLIVLVGRDHQSSSPSGTSRNLFHPETWPRIAQAAQVPDKAVEVCDASQQDPRQVSQDFLEAVATSGGKTVIAIEAHGAREAIDLSVDPGTEKVIQLDEVAKSFVTRAVRERDARALDQVTLINDACWAYDFSHSLGDALRRAIEADPVAQKLFPQSIQLPHIITAAQEGSLMVVAESIGETLAEQINGLKKDGAVTGERLLRFVQPEMYYRHDMTILLPSPGGLMELGALQKMDAPTTNPFRTT